MLLVVMFLTSPEVADHGRNDLLSARGQDSHVSLASSRSV